MTPEMERVLAEAKAYGDWFSTSHHPMSPVRARHQTLKALYARGFLTRVTETKRINHSSGSQTMYKYIPYRTHHA